MNFLLRKQDSNLRPPSYEHGELPTATIPHSNYNNIKLIVPAFLKFYFFYKKDKKLVQMKLC